jgi:hypothetical protein
MTEDEIRHIYPGYGRPGPVLLPLDRAEAGSLRLLLARTAGDLEAEAGSGDRPEFVRRPIRDHARRFRELESRLRAAMGGEG